MKPNLTQVFVSLVATILLALLAIPVSAQQYTGSVTGTVVDPTGAVIPGATVTLTNEATGVTREQASSSVGAFNFERLRPGIYGVRISMTGFRTYEARQIEVSVGKVSALGTVMLEVGAEAETVEVEASVVPLVQAESPQVVGVYESRQVADLTWGTFGLDAIAFLTPGIVPGFGNINNNTGGFAGITGGDATPAAGGMRARSTQFSLDGTEINDITLGGPNLFIDNLDLVGEYQVTVNQFDVSQGRMPGAQVNISTKGGTNDIHGSLFWFYDIDAFRAKTSNEARRELEKPKFIDNAWGFTAGGPIIKNKWFGFGGYRGEHIPGSFTAVSQSNRAFTPTGAAALAAAVPNAATSLYASAGPFARLDGDPRCDPGTETVLTDFGGSGVDVPACDVIRDVPDNTILWEYMLKMDYVASNQTFSGRWYDQKSQFCCVIGGELGAGYWVALPNRNQSLQFSHTYNFSPRVINDFRFSFDRLFVAFAGANTEGLGDIRGNTTNVDMPANIMGLGLATNLPQGRLVTNFQYQDNVSIVTGRHTVKAGMEVRRNRTTAPFLPFVNGAYDYGTRPCSPGDPGDLLGLCVDTDDPKDGVVDTLPGRSAFVNDLGATRFTDGPISFQPFETDQFYYIQDDIRIRPNFLLNIGVRYENTGQPVNAIHEEQLKRESDPAAAIWLQSLPLEQRVFSKIDRDDNNWAPAIGFSYTPRWGRAIWGDNKTVIRGGYRVAYEAAFYNILLNITTAAPRVFGFTVLDFPMAPGGTGEAVAAAIPAPRDTFDPREQFRTIVPTDFGSPYAQIWQLGIQRQFRTNMVYEVRYMGNRNIGQYQSINRNPLFTNLAASFPDLTTPPGATPCPPGASPSTFGADSAGNTSATGRLFCDSGPLRERRNSARSNYHAVQMRFDVRNLGDQVTGGLGFTWSKMIDNVSEIFFFTASGSPSFSQNPFDFIGAERGLSNQNPSRTFTAHWIWDTPVFRSQEGVLGKIVGGWQLNGQLFLYDGFPWTPSQIFSQGNAFCAEDVPFNVTFIGTIASCRPYLADPTAPQHTVDAVGTPGVRFWINNGSITPFGVGRNNFFGDGTVALNMGVFKNTRFGREGRFNVQYRLMVRNVANNRNFGTPLSIFVESGNFGRFRRNVSGRFIRMALRFIF